MLVFARIATTALEFKKRGDCSEVSLIACSWHTLRCTPKTLTQQFELISWSRQCTEGSQKSAAVCSPAPEISPWKSSLFYFFENFLKHQFTWETAQKKSDGEWRLQDVHHIHHQKKTRALNFSGNEIITHDHFMTYYYEQFNFPCEFSLSLINSVCDC